MDNTPDPVPAFDTAAVRAAFAGMGIDTEVIPAAPGQPGVRLDREGLEKLRDAASAHGAIAIAAAIDIALAERPDDGGLS